MFNCSYCDLEFEEKRLLVTHQKTKKCTTYRSIGFVCQKCFQNIKGYDNTIKHVEACKENVSGDGLLQTLINQLSLNYKVDLILDDTVNEGRINFKRVHNYIHPKKLECGISVPLKPYLFIKTLNKNNDSQIMGCHGLYLNDVSSQIFRLSDTFQFLSVKYDLVTLMNILWLEVPSKCFYLKDTKIFILGKVQAQNNEDKKWFGDTFILKDDEKIIKCVWYQDSHLKSFFSNLNPLLKDILNLYLTLGSWALKQKKIRFKNTTNVPCVPGYYNKIISEIMEEYNLATLVSNIQKLSSYETFYQIFNSELNKKKNGSLLPSNIQHVFKDEILPSPLINENFSLMTMNDPERIGGNYFYLMDYILPEEEKLIFRSKE